MHDETATGKLKPLTEGKGKMNDDPNQSVWVHNWTDAGYRERYVFHARENYQESKQLRLAAQAGHMDYGKWLIASMLAVHGGTIYAISNLRDHVDPTIAGALISAAALNVAGIASIMVAGFMAWLNFQCAEMTYFRRTNPAKLYRTDIKEEPQRLDPVSATLYGAAVSGIVSWLLFIGSAAEVFRALRSVVGNPPV